MEPGFRFVLRVLCWVVGYLLGSFLTAELVARGMAGSHARDIGDGNPGVVNMLLHLGVPAGLLVLAGDTLKTALACLLCYRVGAPELGCIGMQYAGLGATFGHNWPLRHPTGGGKGVAVTCTWLTVALPGTGLLCCAAGGALVLWTGYLPLGAVIIPLAAVPVAWLQFGAESAALAAVAAVVMLVKHRHGLARIRAGTERRYLRCRDGGKD